VLEALVLAGEDPKVQLVDHTSYVSPAKEVIKHPLINVPHYRRVAQAFQGGFEQGGGQMRCSKAVPSRREE